MVQRRTPRAHTLARLREERRLAEERFSACYAALPLSTVTWQRQGDDFILSSFNTAAEQLTRGGVTRLRGITARTLFAARPDLVAELEGCFQSGSPRHLTSPYQLVTTGETRDLDLSFIPLPPDQVVVHMQDLTALRAAEQRALEREALASEDARRSAAAVLEINERLRRALDDLRAAQERTVQQERLRALGEMASGVAHDLNNALAPVVGFTELLLAVPGALADTARARQQLRLVEAGAKDAVEVVRRLREFYRPRSDADSFSPVDLHDVVTHVIALTEPRWRRQAQGEGRTIELKTDLQPVPPISGSDSELREALTNLVLNAVDALPSGGEITIATRPLGQRVLLEVRDSGVGMSDEVRARCLEPFFTTKGESGTGLGLAMVHGTVRRHSAELDIQSSPHTGTTIRLSFAALRDGPILPPVPTRTHTVRPLRLLVVDDEPAVRDVVTALLRAEGHTVEALPDGHAAVERLLMQSPPRFDLVITDRAMPGVSGDELAAIVQRVAPGLPLILLTGFGDLMRARGELPPGVLEVLAKPIRLEDLRAALQRLPPSRPAP